MPTNDSSRTTDPWGIFEPAATTMERLLPIKNPILWGMYVHTRREWWRACRRAHLLLLEARQYGPSVTGSNLAQVVQDLIHYEGALDALRAADLQLRRAK